MDAKPALPMRESDGTPVADFWARFEEWNKQTRHGAVAGGTQPVEKVRDPLDPTISGPWVDRWLPASTQ